MDNKEAKRNRAKPEDNPTRAEHLTGLAEQLRKIATSLDSAAVNMKNKGIEELIAGNKAGVDEFFDRVFKYMKAVVGEIEFPPSMIKEAKESYSGLSTPKEMKEAARKTLKKPKNP